MTTISRTVIAIGALIVLAAGVYAFAPGKSAPQIGRAHV